MYEDHLYHHGVKGMKWGVRKTKSSISSISKKMKSRSEAKKRDKIAKKEARKVIRTEERKKKKVRVKDLSNEELQSKIKRLQMEKQYRDLKKDEVSAGRKLVGDILKTSGKTIGVQVVNYVAGKAINAAMKDEVVKIGKSKDSQSSKKKAA